MTIVATDRSLAARDLGLPVESPGLDIRASA
jgi:hypothetical protein